MLGAGGVPGSAAMTRGHGMPQIKLTERQFEVLEAAHKASDGWICRGFSRIWGIAPAAVHAVVKRGYLEMPHGQGRARLTAAGRALIEGRSRYPFVIVKGRNS